NSVRGRHKGIGAVIDIQHGALRALKEHLASADNFFVEITGGVRDIWRQTVAQATVAIEDLLKIERLFFQDSAKINILLLQIVGEFLPEQRFIEQVDEANADPRHFILVRWPNASASGADAPLAAQPFAGEVNGFVVGHDQVRGLTNLQQ